MKKITIGIKENDKVVFLQTEEFNDRFDCQKLIRAIKTVVDIFVRREGGDNKNETISAIRNICYSCVFVSCSKFNTLFLF